MWKLVLGIVVLASVAVLIVMVLGMASTPEISTRPPKSLRAAELLLRCRLLKHRPPDPFLRPSIAMAR